MTYETPPKNGFFRATERASARRSPLRRTRRAPLVAPCRRVVPCDPRGHWPEPVRLPEWVDEEKAPRHFRCPITLCVIREPAVTPAGISYERSALMQWLEHQHGALHEAAPEALAGGAQPHAARDDRGLARGRARRAAARGDARGGAAEARA